MTTSNIILGLGLCVALGACGDVETFESEVHGGSVDVAADPDDDGQAAFACEAVDILFVVDNSPSMADEQQNLVEAVPGFVDAMRRAFPEIKSVHIGVVDTDAYPAIGTDPEHPLQSCPEGVDCSQCDYTLGALVAGPFSGSVPGESCEFSTGGRFMDAASDNFEAEFACAVTVGTEGNPVERPAEALVTALDADMSGVGECNEGFLRDEARLVTVIVSDEEDDHRQLGGSTGDPEAWYAAVAAAKGGRTDEIVALGLLGGAPKFDDCAEKSTGNDGAELTPRLVTFIEQFEHGHVGSVCGNGYDGFFRQALAAVEESCTVTQ